MQSSEVARITKQEKQEIDGFFQDNPLYYARRQSSLVQSASDVAHEILVEVGATSVRGLHNGLVFGSMGIAGAAVGGLGALIITPLITGPIAPAATPPAVYGAMAAGAAIGIGIFYPAYAEGVRIQKELLAEKRKYRISSLYSTCSLEKYNQRISSILERCFTEDDLITCPITTLPIAVPITTSCNHLFEAQAIHELFILNHYKMVPCPVCRTKISYDSLKIDPAQFRRIHDVYVKKFIELEQKARGEKIEEARLRIEGNKDRLASAAQAEIDAKALVPVKEQEKKQRLSKDEQNMRDGLAIAVKNIEQANVNLFGLDAAEMLKSGSKKIMDPADIALAITALGKQRSLRPMNES